VPRRAGHVGVACEDARVLNSLAGRPENHLQARILTELRDVGALSRAQLGEELAVSRTTVAAEVARLTELGLAKEGGRAASRGGRRSTMVDLADDLRFVGISIGATGLSVAVTDGRLAVLGIRSVPTDVRLGPETVLQLALSEVRALLESLGVDRLVGAGVGVPGPVDFHRGVPISPPIMPGWDGYPVRDTLARELACPVVLDNDVNLMASGELHAGVARQTKNFLFVKIGTGIGCGIVVDGRLWRGVDGCAGDIGHIGVEEFGPTCACGNTGCLEALAGGAALARDATAAARSGRSAGGQRRGHRRGHRRRRRRG
jgi:DNA-binding Lrp family transcriptional regulator